MRTKSRHASEGAAGAFCGIEPQLLVDFDELRTVVAMASTRPVRVLVSVAAVALLASCASRPSAPETVPLPFEEPAAGFLRSSSYPDRVAVRCDAPIVLRTRPGWRATDVASTGVSQGASVSIDAKISQDATEVTLPSGRVAYRVTLQGDKGSRVLTVQCLPEGFPVVTVTGRFSSPLLLTAGPASLTTGYRLLLDRDGFPLWFEEVTPVFGALMLHEGRVLRHSGATRPVVTHDNVAGHGFELVASDGGVLRSWVPGDGVGLDFHAAQVLSNGNLLAVRYAPGDVPAGSSAIVAGIEQKEYTCPARPMRDYDGALYGRVVEVTPQGQVRHSWSVEEHLPGAEVSAEGVFVGRTDDGQPRCLVDLHHLNGAVFYQEDGAAPGHGHVLVTGRHVNGAMLVAWPSGRVEWTLGGRQGPQALAVVDDPLGGPFRPHDANLVDDRLLLYDNRDVGQPSRAVVYRIDVQTMTATLESSYISDCTSAVTASPGRTERTDGPCAAFVMGSARALPGGAGVLVGWGASAVTASEFAWDGTEPRAQLALGGLWSYRVVPVDEADVVRFLGP